MKYLLTFFILLFLSDSIDAAKIQKRKKVTTFSPFSFLVSDSDGNILQQKNSDVKRPIASISKLLIGLVASKQDLYEVLYISRDKKLTTSIPRGVNHLTRRDLLILALVKSDNLAAQVLCDNVEECVLKMNELAAGLDMNSTFVVEPTGLDRNNISTADDLLKLLVFAGNDPVVSELSSMQTAEIHADGKIIKINNTNPLTHKFHTLVSKTGYTTPAGGCLVMAATIAGQTKYYILLGSRNTRTRIIDMQRLINSK